MSRPIKWSRDLHAIREKALHSRTETWARLEIEHLFNVGRATAQTLMKAIGEIQPVAGAHFVERQALVTFLEVMIASPDLETAYRERLADAALPPKSKSLRISLPEGLRSTTVRELPAHIRLTSGRLEIDAVTAVDLLEALTLLARVMQDDLDQVCNLVEPPRRTTEPVDEELREFFLRLRHVDTE